MGGGFAEALDRRLDKDFSQECLAKYNHSLLAAFQRLFKLLPISAVIEDEILVLPSPWSLQKHRFKRFQEVSEAWRPVSERSRHLEDAARAA